ncbi:MAG: hypothetical protein AAGA37_19790 [Actinomycetota bacterium]
MAPRPKTFKAVRAFRAGGQTFAVGDEVPNPSAALAAVLPYGDEFVEATNTRRKADHESEAD